MSVAALILAAGEGTRMKSDLPKVAHAVLGVPMIRLVIDAARDAGCDPVVAVTGHRAEAVEAICADTPCVRQERQLGTGHAVACAAEALASFDGSLLVLSGDTPLVRPETLRLLAETREKAQAAAVVLTATPADPTGYGRIVRGADGTVEAIVEQKDLGPGQESLGEVNTGTYCFDARLLFEHLDRLSDSNAQGEYYLTDMVGILRAEGHGVEAVAAADADEPMGINSRVQLAEATKVLQRRVNRAHMLAGVTMTDPDLVWIAPTVRLGRDVVIEPMTFLYGDTVVEDGAVIGPQARLSDSYVAAGARVDASVLVGARVGPDASVGPVAYLRPGAVLEAGAKAGTCVEIKNSVVGPGSKVPHLSYVGDAVLGADVNIGAGTITCNYDGFDKHRTEVGDGVFVGSGTMLIAPVTLGSGSVTGAGSAIARDVPADALALERADQKTFEGWAARRRDRKREERGA